MKPSLIQKEAAFHDDWAKSIDIDTIDINRYFTGVTCPENRFLLYHLGNLSGKKILELGCGAGENSVYFATQGAHCTATDISPGMLKKAQQLTKKHHVRVKTQVEDAMNLSFKANTFDIVYAANTMHHVDPHRMLEETHRVLKPGGLLCTWDPLIHNPLINIYRRLATQIRSDDESPLNISIVKNAQQLFSHVTYDTFWLATLWIFIQFFLIEHVHPNQERYWKKIILEEKRLRPLYLKLESLDRLLKKIPGFKRYAWNIAIAATK